MGLGAGAPPASRPRPRAARRCPPGRRRTRCAPEQRRPQDWCALAFLEDTGTRVVQIQGLPGPATGEVPAEVPFGRILQTLRRDITDQCLPLPDARQVAEQSVRDAGFDPARDAQVTVIEDGAAACTRVDVPLAGLIDVTLRGPAAPSPD